jgi:hypothetical protein
VSKQDRYKGEGASPNRCGHCGKLGHKTSKCYARERKEVRVNQVAVGKINNRREFTCFRCGEKGHISRNCRKPPKMKNNHSNNGKPLGNERILLEKQPTLSRLYSVGCVAKGSGEYINLDLDVSNAGGLNLHPDNGQM